MASKWIGAITLYSPGWPEIAVTFDEMADMVLGTRTTALVLVAPAKDAARDVGMKFSTGADTGRPLVVCGSDEWRGTREDQPEGVLVCLRHTGADPAEFSAHEDLARYRQWMRGMGQTPVV